MDTTITCFYTCHGCGLLDQVVQVQARGEEDVVTWVKETLTAAVALDHANRSPRCVSQQLTNLKIPITGVDKVGGAPIQ